MKNLFKKLTALILAVSTYPAVACDVCKRQQPEILREVSHGTGPEDGLDYLIVGVTMVIVLLTLYYSVKMLVRPKEERPAHIKRFILTDCGHEIQ